MRGLHILAELHGCTCEARLLREVEPLRKLCLAACAGAGLTIVAEAFHGFPAAGEAGAAGATGAVVLAESHLAVHTWPELDAATLDIYVCNFSQDNRAAAEAAYAALHAAFSPRQAVRRDVVRGELART
ncbi:MAG: adenosylmethionine decarboxylase [Gammaproteobacteria bacterium]|nr:adenosylmethionine decarboxylase [Gammaproteobacteria bacterium]MBU1645330.1 adenosylmethionine decarboxylase [Gammaproteobacteria bacterium]MBU1972323.1 adenosylmethionine decarboxylase [Gammaproteobacteria bacterium]